MSNSNKEASASRWPSLMDSAPSDPRNATEPTRVLADLGGHKPPGISAGMIAVACCIVAMGVGAGFWATSGTAKPVAAAAPPAAVATAPAPVAAPAKSADPTPVAAEAAPKSTVSALSALNLEAAPAADPGLVKASDEPARQSKTAAAQTPVQPKAAAPVSVAVKATAPVASKAGADKPRKVAASRPDHKQVSARQARQTMHAVAVRDKAHAPGKPANTTVAKARDDKRREASGAPHVARKNIDPDTDLLAAMLRRNGSNSQ